MAAGGGEGKAARSMSQNKTTKKSAGAQAPRVYEYESYRRLDELLALRSLAPATMEEYRRYVRKLGLRVQRDPAGLEEHEVREYLLRLKTHQHYSPSSMRGACAALRFYYGHVLGRDWKLFDLVRTPTVQHLPQVLSREEVGRLFGGLPAAPAPDQGQQGALRPAARGHARGVAPVVEAAPASAAALSRRRPRLEGTPPWCGRGDR